MKIVLFDTADRNKLFPLTLTRAVADLRMGIFTIKERWEKLTHLPVDVLTDVYLQPLYATIEPGDYLLADARVLPTLELVQAITALEQGDALVDDNGLIIGRTNLEFTPAYGTDFQKHFTNIIQSNTARRIERPHSLFQWNGELIAQDYEIATKGTSSKESTAGVRIINPQNVFISETATVDYCSLNATDGPIYIGNNAVIMEGCVVRGPFVLGDGAVLKMGAKVYGATTLGPKCVGGGEIKNSIMMGYSNKAHDGYLGDSVIGEWCNFGAGTSNSNLKNNVGEVKVWNYASRTHQNAGIKCGVVMGDYSRSAINTSFNTGTVIGIACNVFGEGLTPGFIPDFSWGAEGGNRYDFDKATRDINNWMQLKGANLDETRTKVLKHIFGNYHNQHFE